MASVLIAWAFLHGAWREYLGKPERYSGRSWWSHTKGWWIGPDAPSFNHSKVRHGQLWITTEEDIPYPDEEKRDIYYSEQTTHGRVWDVP